MMFQHDVLTEFSGQRLEDISVDVRVLLNNAGVGNSVDDSAETMLTCVTKGKEQ
jgi:hypothetical protein